MSFPPAVFLKWDVLSPSMKVPDRSSGHSHRKRQFQVGNACCESFQWRRRRRTLSWQSIRESSLDFPKEGAENRFHRPWSRRCWSFVRPKFLRQHLHLFQFSFNNNWKRWPKIQSQTTHPPHPHPSAGTPYQHSGTTWAPSDPPNNKTYPQNDPFFLSALNCGYQLEALA